MSSNFNQNSQILMKTNLKPHNKFQESFNVFAAPFNFGNISLCLAQIMHQILLTYCFPCYSEVLYLIISSFPHEREVPNSFVTPLLVLVLLIFFTPQRATILEKWSMEMKINKCNGRNVFYNNYGIWWLSWGKCLNRL